MSENDVPYSSGCFAAGLFLLVHLVLLIVFINLHIGLFFPIFCVLEFIVSIIEGQEPARVTIEAKSPIKNVDIEIEVTALIPNLERI